MYRKYFNGLFFDRNFQRQTISDYNLAVHTSLGWESLQPQGGEKDDGVCAFLSFTRSF